jgi:hypothetical protein
MIIKDSVYQMTGFAQKCSKLEGNLVIPKTIAEKCEKLLENLVTLKTIIEKYLGDQMKAASSCCAKIYLI